ncbi:hypothetical protein [Escherichia coli]|uniref:hypothetical protein n=1 Tax=Escherichia coli TaxID=562 RepID=UPI00286F098F|nr:hypothetical protein [Escherichia coli]
MAIRRRRRMFILFAERKVGEQHGPAAQGVLAAVQTLREMNADNLRKVPADAPTAFIKPRWKKTAPALLRPSGPSANQCLADTGESPLRAARPERTGEQADTCHPE